MTISQKLITNSMSRKLNAILLSITVFCDLRVFYIKVSKFRSNILMPWRMNVSGASDCSIKYADAAKSLGNCCLNRRYLSTELNREKIVPYPMRIESMTWLSTLHLYAAWHVVNISDLSNFRPFIKSPFLFTSTKCEMFQYGTDVLEIHLLHLLHKTCQKQKIYL